MAAVDIYTDGACSPNPGRGGWGAVLRYGAHEKQLCGSETSMTTNNRMELTAPIMALESLTRRSIVRLHTDSTYVPNGITKWVPRWKLNGWQTTTGEPVKNADLWLRLEAAVARHDVQWFWVKGHCGHPENERADQLANRGLRQALTLGEVHHRANVQPVPVQAELPTPHTRFSHQADTTRATGQVHPGSRADL